MAPTVKGSLRAIPPPSEICYFLGAGFSKASNYELPTANEFLSRDALIYCRDRLNQKGTISVSKHPDLSQLLIRLEARYGDVGSLNLEDVMSDLYERSAGIGEPWSNRDATLVDRVLPFRDPDVRAIAPDGIPVEPAPEGSDLGRDYGLLLRFICLRLRVVEASDDECPRVHRFLSTLRRRDSIITLNYDTIVERHLTRRQGDTPVGCERLEMLNVWIGPPGSTHGGAGVPIIEPFQPTERGYLVKLHGSVNWRACPRPMCPNHWYIQPTEGLRPEMGDGVEQGRCTACGSIPDVVIIPPIALKSFDRFPKLRLMWLQAFHALRLAPRWVFIGVSFAPTDMQLRSLVRAASEDWFPTGIAKIGQICVVNKGSDACLEAADRLWQCLSPRVQRKLSTDAGGITTFGSVDDYLAAVESTDVSRAPDPV